MSSIPAQLLRRGVKNYVIPEEVNQCNTKTAALIFS